MGHVLGIVYRAIATHLIKKAEQSHKTTRTGAVTLIQRFGSALNLNTHMLFLDGVYVEGANGMATRFRWVKATTLSTAPSPRARTASRLPIWFDRGGLPVGLSSGLVVTRQIATRYFSTDHISKRNHLGHSGI